MTAASLITGAGNESQSLNQPNTNTQVISFTKPANLAAGQRMVAVIGYQNNSLGNSTVITLPGSGVTWTRISTAYTVLDDANRRPSYVYLSDPVTNPATEPSTYDFTTNGTSARAIGYLCLATGVHTTYPQATATGGGWCTTASATASQSRTIDGFTADIDEVLSIAYVHWQTNSSGPNGTTWTGATEVFDGSTLLTTNTHSELSVATITGTTAGAVTAPVATLGGVLTVANGAGQVVALRRAARFTTTMQTIAHRGIATYVHGAAGQAATEEESIVGIDTMMAANGQTAEACVIGVEFDARLPSDVSTTGRIVLCHDATVDRTSPNGSTGTVALMTTAELEDAGMTFLDDMLDHIMANYPTIPSILVQHETAASTPLVSRIVSVLNGYPAWFRAKIVVMTDDGTFAFSNIRAAGWTGRVGSYGMSAANWATFSGDFATYGTSTDGNSALPVGFTDPGDAAYVTNRSHIATMIGDGYQAGASTIVDVATMDYANHDGVTLMLTDDPARMLSLYDTPMGEGAPDEPAEETTEASGAGGWNGLLAIVKENARTSLAIFKREADTLCPLDGTLLLQGPPSQPGVRYCPWDGWRG